MINNIYLPANLLGPLKIYGVSKPSDTRGILRGWFYPLYTTKGEAIQSDLDRGGKGIYEVITFFEREGEFYVAESYYNYGEIKDPIIYTLYDGPGAENPFSKVQNRLSILIEDQLPDFIQSDYTMFITFLKAYYEFLEQNSEVQEVLQNINKYADIDETSENLVEKFLLNYAKDISDNKLTNRQLIVKKIRELYSRKGTESAYRILFNILYKETISFLYPSEFILKPSTGVWTVPKTLRVKLTSSRQNIFDFENTQVVGKTSGAVANINKVQKINIGKYDVFELILDTPSIRGDFIAGEDITAVKYLISSNVINSSALTATLYSVISKIDILDGKLGYEKGHVIQSITDNNNTGSFAVAKVNSVNRFGTIVNIQIEEAGLNYSSNIEINAGKPTGTIQGRYAVRRGVVTVEFPNDHGMKIGTNINAFYTGNIYSPVDNTRHKATIVSVPNVKTVRFRYPGF